MVKPPKGDGQPVSNVSRTSASSVKMRKGEDLSTLLTLEQADNIVNPVLMGVSQLVRRNGERTVPGWLNRLRMWLLRLERGNKHDARTPIFKSLSYSEVESRLTGLVKRNLSGIKKKYASCQGADFFFEKLEVHQAGKIGPRGVYPPASDWMPELTDIVMSDSPPSEDLDRGALIKAIQDLVSCIPEGSLHADESSIEEGFRNAGTEDASSLSLNVDTNSCYPTYVRRWYHKVWTKAVSLAQRMVQVIIVTGSRRIWQELLGTPQDAWRRVIPLFVGTAHQRTNVANGHVANENNTFKKWGGIIFSKLRLVVAMPKKDTVIGKIYLNRLIPAVLTIRNSDGSRPFIALTTPERIDKNMQIILDTAAKNHLTVLSTDFSHFDQSVPPWLAWEIAKAIVVWFEPRIRAGFLAWVYAAFYNTMLITPYKIYGVGPSRMKSGSWLTNIFDSFINYVSQRYGLHAGFYKSILAQVVQGDDAVLLGEGVTPESFEKCVAQLNFEGNADKQGYDPGVLYFCQKMHIHGYPGGIYPISRACMNVLSLEDDVGIETDQAGQFPYVLSYRTVCRLDSACFNPLFVDFVNAVALDDGIHLGRGMTAHQLAKLAGSYHTKMQQEYLDKPWKAHGSDRNGKPSGFETFPVNRVLRGELPPPPGIRLFEWVYGIPYGDVQV